MRRSIEREIARTLNLDFADNDPVWCDAKEVLINGGWRSGKSTRGAFKGFTKLLDPSVRLIWLVGPDYIQSREEFRYMFEWAVELRLIPEPIKQNSGLPQNGSRWFRTITGALVETKSAKHPETLASKAPDFVLLCEPGQMPSEVYDMVQGRLLERRGDLWMVGTLENEEGVLKPRWQWYEDFAVRWLKNGEGARERAFSLPTWSNHIIFPLGLDDPELQARRAKTSEYTWRRRYGGEPMGIENPVFGLLHEPGFENEVLDVPPEGMTFTGGAIGVDYGRCVPLDTEILTRDGFKSHDEVGTGDEVAVFDPASGSLIWSPLVSKEYFPAQTVVRIEQKGFRFTCTPDHAWAVEMKRTGRVERRELSRMLPNDKVVVAAPMYDGGGLDCSPAEAAVLGWLVTDGWTQGHLHDGKFSATLSQKSHVSEMLADLEESRLPYSKLSRESGGVKCFRLATPAIRDLFTRVGYEGKESLIRLITHMSYTQRVRMFRAMLLAEGHKGGVTFCQNDGPVLEAFYVLATLIGQRLGKSSVVVRGDKVNRRVHLSPATTAKFMKIRHAGVADTWCPTTTSGYWVARQGDQITITGNSWNHPSAVVAVSIASDGTYWVRAGWKGVKADPREIASVCSRFEDAFNIWQGMTDPNQGFMADTLGYEVAKGGSGERGGTPTDMRFSLVNGLLESRDLYFDLWGENVREVLASMRSMRWVVNPAGKLYYERPIGDDMGMALCYAIEMLRGGESVQTLPLAAGSTRFFFAPSAEEHKGYA